MNYELKRRNKRKCAVFAVVLMPMLKKEDPEEYWFIQTI